MIVAGAGPAGVAAATVAAQAGLRVCLLNEQGKQAMKIGESLPGAALRLLRRLGIPDLSDILTENEFKRCVANVSAWGSNEWSYTDAMANPDGGGFHLLRHRFDAALLNYAVSQGLDFIPAKLIQVALRAALPCERSELSPGCAGLTLKQPSPDYSDCRNSQVLIAGEGQERPRTLTGRFLVDATGRSAALSAKLGVRRMQVSNQTAAVAWFRHPERDVDNTTRLKSVENGWWYTARLPQGLRVFAFHGLANEIAHMMKQPHCFVTAANAVSLVAYDLEQSHLVQPLKSADAAIRMSESAAGPAWLAVGDAALSFDPLSSQGMFFAMYSGIRGGEALQRCLAQPESSRSVLSEYQQKVRGVFEANQRSRRLFYESERRFPASEYWKSQRESCKQGVS